MYFDKGQSIPLSSKLRYKGPSSEMPKRAKPLQKGCILIVEDSPDFSNLLKFLVEDEGFEGVQYPIDNEDIVSWAKDCKPAVILMDLALRRKGGMDFIEDLKADPATKNIPIVIITGRDLSQKDVVGLELRGVKYLRKGRVEINEIKHLIMEAARPKKGSPAAE